MVTQAIAQPRGKSFNKNVCKNCFLNELEKNRSNL